MNKLFYKIILIGAVIGIIPVLSACGSLNRLMSPKEKINPEHVYSSEGFRFQFALKGEWYFFNSKPGFFAVGQKPLEDGSTKMATAHYGSMATPGGKPMSNRELIEVFKLKVKAEAQGGRLSNVQTRFSEKKFKKADCLLFFQKATDNVSDGERSLSNDGMICIHPIKPYKFIWMALSERVPIEKKPSDLFEDEKSFFESLEFD